MTEKLKFTITYRKTVSDGNYGSEQVGIMEEFYVNDHNRDYEVDRMRDWVNKTLKEGN